MMRKSGDSEGGMPFSWEKKPGISKVSAMTATATVDQEEHKRSTHSKIREIRRLESATSTTSKWLPLPPSCQHPHPPDDVDDDQRNKSIKLCVGQQQELLKIPLPPCLFQPPYNSRSGSSMKGFGPLGARPHEQDPFLEAYKECTKSVRLGNCTPSSSRYPNGRTPNSIKIGNDDGDDNGNSEHKRRGSTGAPTGSSLLRKSGSFFFSCKQSCEVRDDNFISFSHLSLPPHPAPKQRLSKHRFPNK